MAGTHDDAVDLFEFAKWGPRIGITDASGKVWADDFAMQKGQLNDSEVCTVVVFNETVATLVQNDLLDRDLA